MADMNKLVVFPSQVVEKSTMCANCIHYDADATKIMEEWRPVQAKEVERIKRGILLGGMQIAGFERADVGLKVAELTRPGPNGQPGLSVPQAVAMIESALMQEAMARVGGDPEKAYMADLRYAIVASTEMGIRDGKLGRCRGGGVDPKGQPVGFLVFSAYHCHKWTGRTGHSLAHDGRPLDPLPAELMEIADEKAKQGS